MSLNVNNGTHNSKRNAKPQAAHITLIDVYKFCNNVQNCRLHASV